MIRQFLSNATAMTPSPFERERTPEDIAMHRQNIIVNAVDNLEVFELRVEASNATSATNKVTFSNEQPTQMSQDLNSSATKAGEVVVMSEQNYDSDDIRAMRNNIAQNAIPAEAQRQTFVDSDGSIG